MINLLFRIVESGSDFKQQILRVPNRFFGIRDLAYFKPGFGILKEEGSEIRDCNYDRDTGFGDFNRQESGNVALKKPRFGNSRD